MCPRIVTASNHDIPHQLLTQYQIISLPFPIVIKGETFYDGLDLTTSEVLEAQKAAKNDTELPRTTAIFAKDFIKIFQELASTGEDIIVILMSSKLTTATFETANIARSKVPQARIEVVDSRQTAGGVGVIVLEAAKAAIQGKNTDEILEIIQHAIANTSSIFALSDLNYLYKGGRIGKAQSLLGGMMKIIALVKQESEEGIVSPLSKARNWNQVYELMLKKIKEDLEKRNSKKLIRCLISHTHCGSEAQELKKRIQENFSCEEIIIFPASATVAIYMGDNSLGIGYLME